MWTPYKCMFHVNMHLAEYIAILYTLSNIQHVWMITKCKVKRSKFCSPYELHVLCTGHFQLQMFKKVTNNMCGIKNRLNLNRNIYNVSICKLYPFTGLS